MGDAIYTNLLLLGHAWQMGLVPVSLAALERAIELNGTAVEANLEALNWGRRVAVFPERVAALAGPLQPAPLGEVPLDALIEQRAQHLVAYQDRELAARYRHRIATLRALGDDALTRLVAVQYARLLAPKDEYEVARLFVESDFLARLKEQFEPLAAGQALRPSFHLVPPWGRREAADGRPRKQTFGPWLWPLLRVLAAGRHWRGRWFDPLRLSSERSLDRDLLAAYEADLDLILQHGPGPAAQRLAAWPAEVRGFGPVKATAASAAMPQRQTAREALPPLPAANG